MGLPSVSLGLVLAATVIACTAIVIAEIREARRDIAEKLLQQKRTL